MKYKRKMMNELEYDKRETVSLVMFQFVNI